ncbi:MAG: hypothetical protein AB7G11_01905 [Phycisphaerales bacterium]
MMGERVLEVSAAGVLVEGSGGAQLVGWDRVKRVIGPKAPEAEAFAETGNKAWRSAERLRRGDVPAAEPLLEELYRAYRGQRGPTAAMACEGLARCRAARGAVATAVLPWLYSLAAHPKSDEAGAVWVGGTIDNSRAGGGGNVFIDPRYMLSPSLPPVWLAGAALDSLAASAAWAELKLEPGPAGELASLYALAAKLSAGGAASASEAELIRGDSSSQTPGAALVRDMLAARFGDDAVRVDARARLRVRIERAAAKPTALTEGTSQIPRWVEAWCRFAIGQSMVRESDENARVLGVIELMHLPARFGTEQPYLAGLALAEGIATLADLGDRSGSGVLKHELLLRFPRHPGVNLERVRSVKAVAPHSQESEPEPAE